MVFLYILNPVVCGTRHGQRKTVDAFFCMMLMMLTVVQHQYYFLVHVHQILLEQAVEHALEHALEHAVEHAVALEHAKRSKWFFTLDPRAFEMDTKCPFQIATRVRESLDFPYRKGH